MRIARWVIAAAGVGLLLGGCGPTEGGGSDSQDGGPTAEQDGGSTEQQAGGQKELREAYQAGLGADKQSWVSSVELDGKAVVMHTDLTTADEQKILATCQSGYVAANDSGVNFQSVTVRGADEDSLASRNELRGDTSCQM